MVSSSITVIEVAGLQFSSRYLCTRINHGRNVPAQPIVAWSQRNRSNEQNGWTVGYSNKKLVARRTSAGNRTKYILHHMIDYKFPEAKKTELFDLIPSASTDAIDLMESMLQWSARNRPSAAEILKHPFF